jgi:hypothetical protein
MRSSIKWTTPLGMATIGKPTKKVIHILKIGGIHWDQSGAIYKNEVKKISSWFLRKAGELIRQLFFLQLMNQFG